MPMEPCKEIFLPFRLRVLSLRILNRSLRILFSKARTTARPHFRGRTPTVHGNKFLWRIFSPPTLRSRQECSALLDTLCLKNFPIPNIPLCETIKRPSTFPLLKRSWTLSRKEIHSLFSKHERFPQTILLPFRAECR